MPSIMMRHSKQGPSFVRFSVLAGVCFNEISAKEVVKLSFFRTCCYANRYQFPGKGNNTHL